MKKILFLMATLVVFGSFGCSKIDKNVAFLQFTIGDVEIFKDSKSIEPVLDMKIEKGMKIKTGDNSLASIQVGDSIIVKVSANSDVDISEMFTSNKIDLRLQRGKTLINASKLLKSKSFTVTTPVAVAAIRGTRFSVAYNPSKLKSTVAVKEGKVQVTSISNKKEIMATESKAIVVEQDLVERKITKIESIELDKVDNKAIMKKKTSKIEVLIEKDKEIQKILDKEKAKNEITLDSLRAKYGRIDVVTLYTGKKYAGIITKRGSYTTMLTPSGTVRFKSVKIRLTSAQ